MQNYKVRTTPSFEASIRRLSHKYRRIRQDMEEAIPAIEKSPTNAVAIPGYAHRLWKKRVRNGMRKQGNEVVIVLFTSGNQIMKRFTC